MPDWTPVIIEAAVLVAVVTILIKKMLPDFVLSKIKESEKTLAEKLSKSEYDRARTIFREDAAVDMLGSTLDWLKKEAEENRKETTRRYDIIQALGKNVSKLAQAIDKNTDRLEDVEKKLHEIQK